MADTNTDLAHGMAAAPQPGLELNSIAGHNNQINNDQPHVDINVIGNHNIDDHSSAGQPMEQIHDVGANTTTLISQPDSNPVLAQTSQTQDHIVEVEPQILDVPPEEKIQPLPPSQQQQVPDPVSTPNPWAIQSLEECIYYCCPECDKKNISKQAFLSHAWETHPTVR